MDYSGLPENLRGGVERYIEDGVATGDFLKAVISNDLINAVGRADFLNIDRLAGIVNWFYNNAPMSCWGSKEKYEDWVKGSGLNG